MNTLPPTTPKVADVLSGNHEGEPKPFRTETCSFFLNHWKGLRTDGLVPHTNAFFSRPPARLMPFVFVHDLTPDGLLVRYMGTGLVERWKHDLTGQIFAATMGPAAVQKVTDRARTLHARLDGLQRCATMTLRSSRRAHHQRQILRKS